MCKILNCKIIFSGENNSKKLVSKSDSYTKRLSKFDLQAKIKNNSPGLTEKDYLDNAIKFLENWNAEEIELLQSYVVATENKIKKANIKFELPDEIFFVKSSMEEEAGAKGFTRENYIVFNYNHLSEHLVQHELFHVISRFNHKKASESYGILGFRKMKEIRFPDGAFDLRITNPDAPFLDHYITVNVNEIQKNVGLIIYSKKEYEGGDFFSYVSKGLILLTGDSFNQEVVYKNGNPIIYSFEEVSGLFEQIGKNTNYNIHQEEITSEHFTFLLDEIHELPNPELVIKLQHVFQQ